MGKGQKERFLIIGTGRSGSSLLAAILADAGANFHMSATDSWDRTSGAYEHPKLHQAYTWYSRAQKIAKSLLPDAFGRRFCEQKMKNELSTLLVDTVFAKSSKLVSLVQPIYKLGYIPKIIVSYRDFEGYSISRYIRFGWMVEELSKTYIDINLTALLELNIFGGCAISYRELIDKQETGWAEAVAAITDLDYQRLLEGREERMQSREPGREIRIFSCSRAHEVYSQLLQFKGEVVDSLRNT